MERLQEKYNTKVAPKIMKDFNLSNVMEVPKIQKVCINSGIGEFRENKDSVESFVNDLASISGQKPHPRGARLSEAGFKIRKGEVVGYSVTLRKDKMWAFLDKFINIALPRVRDFRGVKEDAFDTNGNYSIGIKEHVIFPEVDANTTKGIRNMQITIVFSSKDKDKNKTVLTELGMPFTKGK